MVARDDLPDGGFAHVAACVTAIRDVRSGTTVETLVSDAKGDDASLQLLFDVRPDVFNHNIETVARLQRAVRPSAGYARSLSVLARAKAAGLTVKSGLMVGLGETSAEVDGLLADLATVGVDIVTIGQYLRPTSNHLPVARWVDPAEFDRGSRRIRGQGVVGADRGCQCHERRRLVLQAKPTGQVDEGGRARHAGCRFRDTLCDGRVFDGGGVEPEHEFRQHDGGPLLVEGRAGHEVVHGRCHGGLVLEVERPQAGERLVGRGRRLADDRAEQLRRGGRPASPHDLAAGR
jgi:hypothetical protein